jgi:hypothetical protein
MAINFPSGAVLNQIYTYNNLQWQWNGSAWIIYSPDYTAINAATGGTFDNGTIFLSGTGVLGTITGFSTSTAFTGGTVSGATNFTGGLSANTISATTYQNLPTDIRVTGGTYSASSSTIIFTNNTGGTFNVTGITATGGGSFTGGTVSGATQFTGGLTANTISATTYQNLPSQFSTKSFGIVIDGGGSPITTGIKGDLVSPYNMTITSWTILADTTGSTVIDIWKDPYSVYPPVSGDTIITGGTKPSISSGIKNQSVSVTGWNTTISSGDILRFNVDSASTITRITLSLNGTLI